MQHSLAVVTGSLSEYMLNIYVIATYFCLPAVESQNGIVDRPLVLPPLQHALHYYNNSFLHCLGAFLLVVVAVKSVLHLRPCIEMSSW